MPGPSQNNPPDKTPSEAPLPETPISEATFLILASLGREPKHGYAIMKSVEELSRGRVLLSTGTLYGALKRMLADGWVQRVEEGSERQESTGERLESTGGRMASGDWQEGASQDLASGGGRQKGATQGLEGGGRERKYYSLTRRGRAVLRAEARRLSELVDIARLQLNAGGADG